MKYHLVQLGCQMNISDGERVVTVLEQMGFQPTDDEEQAQILGVIACSVRQKAIDKVYSRISKWNKWKNRKNLLTFVSGCILPADRTEFLKTFDLVFAMSELPQLPDMIRQYGLVTPASLQFPDTQQVIAPPTPGRLTLVPPEKAVKEQVSSMVKPEKGINDFWKVEAHYASGFEAFVPIQNGCDKFCTFCAVPYTRGREVSRSSDEILDEIKNLVHKGYKSITLLGQNVNSYGLDKKGEEIRFTELLREIGKFSLTTEKKFWVYFTSPHPRDMTDEVIEVIAAYDCLAKQIHLPLQSGDDKVLLRMNRKHSVAQYRKIMHTIRKLIPQATVFTDIIVGFTGETEAQFSNTRKAFEEFQFNMAYIAQYSVRPGAASSRWADDVPGAVKKERYHTLTADLKKYSLAQNKKLIGQTLDVLVRNPDKKEGYLSGLTEGRIIVRFASDRQALIGKFVKIRITSVTPFSTEGEWVETLEKAVVS